MATYQVVFTENLYVEADSVDEAYEIALCLATEYRLDEAATVEVLEI